VAAVVTDHDPHWWVCSVEPSSQAAIANPITAIKAIIPINLIVVFIELSYQKYINLQKGRFPHKRID
jgi:hypothetical protein